MKQLFQLNHFIILLSIICSLNSCESSNKQLKKDDPELVCFQNIKEQNVGLANFHINDSLFIKVSFFESAKRNGHHEQIWIFRNNKKELMGQLYIDTISSNSIENFENKSVVDDISGNIIELREKKLNEEDEKMINLFLHRILELELNSKLKVLNQGDEEILPIILDTGSVFEINNSNSTIFIKYWNMGQSFNTWYGRIRNRIFFM
ncbi:MAG: hypothetical protein ACLFPE_03670 [Bacteroidales bacterium]